jgi:hypothetical protein
MMIAKVAPPGIIIASVSNREILGNMVFMIWILGNVGYAV